MASDPTPPSVIGAIAHDRDGKPLGTITAVYLDDATQQPTWVGLTPGTHAATPDTDDVPTIAPVAGSEFADGRLLLAVDSAAVHSAPRATRADHLSPDEESALLEHYREPAPAPAPVRTTAQPTVPTRTSDGDGVMTRAEEQLDVTTVVEPWTRAVLRIEEVSEEVLVPVTITRQRARIEHLPLAHGDREAGPASSPGERSSGEREPSRSTGWVTLYAEEPRVSLERVPAERVRLTTSWETEETAVTEQLRHEEVELTTSDTPRD
ncbi:YsnF/AvaK domain-containing protein [Modestobacter sp. VKM Ac-2984]|uniref:YsnF/AvaK domain-containing protein n=1 Tax=Modestobacter sp. VKM Ac-2984 TaxID=3004138 RepID=UPI0022AAF962|nr:YsnF/AvaK domain-containing protein [Modestobacter sp. VKM Ac-2984]MCZ2815732.1 YsnF/AvaK domain-containing protein [Modestobacter sp. VKM Ac-2984]